MVLLLHPLASYPTKLLAPATRKAQSPCNCESPLYSGTCYNIPLDDLSVKGDCLTEDRRLHRYCSALPLIDSFIPSLVPCHGQLDLRFGTKHDVIRPYMEVMWGGTCVVASLHSMCYSAVVHQCIKPLSHQLVLYHATAMYSHLLLDRYLYPLNIHYSNIKISKYDVGA